MDYRNPIDQPMPLLHRPLSAQFFEDDDDFLPYAGNQSSYFADGRNNFSFYNAYRWKKIETLIQVVKSAMNENEALLSFPQIYEHWEGHFYHYMIKIDIF